MKTLNIIFIHNGLIIFRSSTGRTHSRHMSSSNDVFHLVICQNLVGDAMARTCFIAWPRKNFMKLKENDESMRTQRETGGFNLFLRSMDEVSEPARPDEVSWGVEGRRCVMVREYLMGD